MGMPLFSHTNPTEGLQVDSKASVYNRFFAHPGTSLFFIDSSLDLMQIIKLGWVGTFLSEKWLP